MQSRLEVSIPRPYTGHTTAEPAVRVAFQGLLSPRPQRIKRLMDIALAAIFAVPALVLGVAIALAIKLETRGPVFFSQTRIGQGRRRFRLWKFRSMVADADAVLENHLQDDLALAIEWRNTHKLKNDPRVTRIGRLLRRSSLDELPQLWNVLRGDMSMIGPRPIVEDELLKYGSNIALYSRVRPGLTGLWQVCGRNDISYRRRVDLDSSYILNWSLPADLKILFRTVRVVVMGHGAY